MDERVDRLLIIIADDADAGALMEELARADLASTKIGSTGGFLRRGNSTVLCGLPHGRVETALGVVRRTCTARTELVPVQSLPVALEPVPTTELIPVRAGGAVVFVLEVERFEKS